MLPAFRTYELVLGKLGVLMIGNAEVVWLGRWNNFLRRTSAAITVAFQSFKGVFGHYEEVPYLRRQHRIDQYELRTHSKPRVIERIGCENHVRDIGTRP